MVNEKTREFCQRYDIKQVELFEHLYEIDEILLFLPSHPTEPEKEALQSLIGIEGVTSGFIYYVKSNNTFELIVQWKEKTGNL